MLGDMEERGRRGAPLADEQQQALHRCLTAAVDAHLDTLTMLDGLASARTLSGHTVDCADTAGVRRRRTAPARPRPVRHDPAAWRCTRRWCGCARTHCTPLTRACCRPPPARPSARALASCASRSPPSCPPHCRTAAGLMRAAQEGRVLPAPGRDPHGCQAGHVPQQGCPRAARRHRQRRRTVSRSVFVSV
jgi:hypothetical protein